MESPFLQQHGPARGDEAKLGDQGQGSGRVPGPAPSGRRLRYLRSCALVTRDTHIAGQLTPFSAMKAHTVSSLARCYTTVGETYVTFAVVFREFLVKADTRAYSLTC